MLGFLQGGTWDTVKHGGQNDALTELTAWRLEFKEAEAPESCRPELWRRGDMKKKSFKVLHRSFLESLLNTKIDKHWAKRDQGFKLNTFQSSQRGEFWMFTQGIQQKLQKIHVELNYP